MVCLKAIKKVGLVMIDGSVPTSQNFEPIKDIGSVSGDGAEQKVRPFMVPYIRAEQYVVTHATAKASGIRFAGWR